MLAELARLKELPEVPDRWEEADTGLTFADGWNGLTTDAERNAFLKSQQFRVRLWKDRIEIVQGTPGERSFRKVTAPLVPLPRAGWRQAA